MSESDDDDWADYESGPYCRHWSDPTDCDELCDTCGHRCSEHSTYIKVEGACEEFVDE